MWTCLVYGLDTITWHGISEKEGTWPDKYWEQRENPKGVKRAQPPAQSLEILD